MKITNLRTARVVTPLKEKIGVGSWWNETREYVLVWIDTDEGITGVGFSYGGYFEGQGRLVQVALDEYLKQNIVGEDPRNTERLWEKMYSRNLPLSRRGALIWALSAVDVALWDIKAKAAQQPLARLLGGARDEVLAYATCGYYRKGWTERDLTQEMERHLAAGLKAVKLKLGQLDAKEDAKRVKCAREALGPDIKLAIDANNGWKNSANAIRAVRLMEPYDLWWVEEPVSFDNFRGAAQLAAAIDAPVANGEHAVSRWDHRELITQGAAEILQLDATMTGGVSEWMRSAHLAQAFDIPVLPVWFSNLHIHLAAAVPNCLAVEYFVPSEGTFPFETLVQDPVPLVNGMMQVPERPGHGIEFSQTAINQLRVG